MTGPLLGGLSPAEFLARHWQKRPLLIRGALPGWTSPLSPDELAGLACEDAVESRLVIRRRGRWTVRHGPFVETDFATLPKRDWTLLVQNVDAWVPEVASLRDRFRFVPDWRLDDVMVSYAPSGGGVGPHVDRYDVFLLQGMGRRRWRIGGAAEPEAAFLPDQPLELLARFEPAEDWVLEPGDMLYVPPGWAHDGVAEEAGLTFSIGFRAPGLADLAGGLAGSLAGPEGEAARYADPDLVPPANPGEIPEAALDRMRDLLVARLEDRGALAGWVGALLTERRDAPSKRRGRTRGTAALRCALGTRLAFIERPDVLLLFADGTRYVVTTDVAADAARRLCGAGALSAREVASALAVPEGAALLDALLTAGAVGPVR